MMWLKTNSRTVFVLGDDGLVPVACSGGGIEVGDGTLVRDGKQYMYVGKAQAVEIDVARARMIFQAVTAGNARVAHPVAKPTVRRGVVRTQEEHRLTFNVVAARRAGRQAAIEWGDKDEHEERCRELAKVDNRVEGVFLK